MKETSNDFVIPGDHLSFSEEYLPGKNTAELDYRIVSASFGNPLRDKKSLTVSVEHKDRIISIANNDIVYGQVTKSDSRQISITIVGVVKDKEVFYVKADGHLRFNQDRRFNNRGSKPLLIGDLLRARVVRAGQFFELTIDDGGLGVLKSRCNNCREVLVLKDDSLFCVNCNKWEARKIAPDYGSAIFGKR